MKKPTKPTRPVTAQMVQRTIMRQNFWTAFKMLCVKVGKEKEYWWYVRKRDANALEQDRKAFIKKYTRLLAYNYDVHRCPPVAPVTALWESSRPGATPLRFPPEWRD